MKGNLEVGGARRTIDDARAFQREQQAAQRDLTEARRRLAAEKGPPSDSSSVGEEVDFPQIEIFTPPPQEPEINPYSSATEQTITLGGLPDGDELMMERTEGRVHSFWGPRGNPDTVVVVDTAIAGMDASPGIGSAFCFVTPCSQNDRRNGLGCDEPFNPCSTPGPVAPVRLRM